MSPKDRVHVFGSNGLIGGALRRAATQDDREWTFSSRNPGNQSNPPATRLLDIRGKSYSTVLDENETFIFATGLSPAEFKEGDKSDYLDAELTLLREIIDRGKSVVYFSTNRAAQWIENGSESIPLGMRSYVRHKLEIETQFQDAPKVSLIRLGKVFHPELDYFKNWQDDLLANRKITVSSNAFTEPINLNQVTSLVQQVIRFGHDGILEFWAKDSINYLQIATLYTTHLYQKFNVSDCLLDSKNAIPGVNRPPRPNKLVNTDILTLESHIAVLQVLAELKDIRHGSTIS